MSASLTQRHARNPQPHLSVRGALDYLAALDARHRQRVHLSRFDDRLLADIGVTREDVASEVRGSLL